MAEIQLNGLLIGICGPSGVGKGTVIGKLRVEFPQFFYPVSHTTREMRPGEKDGEVYNFITEEEFKAEMDRGNFLEWAQIHQKARYGTLKTPILKALQEGKVIIRELDIQGVRSIKAILKPENFISIFLKPAQFEELRRRIDKRSKLPEEEIQRRLESARAELEEMKECDYQIFSADGGIEECYANVKALILESAQKAGLKL